MSQLLAGASPDLDGRQLTALVIGQPVTKAWTLPASATTQTLFNVLTGIVLVTSLAARVTTAIGSTATTLSLGTVPATGTAETAGIATATAITSLEAGTWLGVQSSSGLAGALVSGGHGGNAVFAAAPFLVNVGTITATTSANAGGGGITFYLTYCPLEGMA